jgi:hypothetical protein
MITTGKRRIVAVAVCTLATLMGGSLALASPAGAAVDDFTVVSTTYSVSSVTVSGLDTKPVTVTVHITDSVPLSTQDFFLWFDFASVGTTGSFVPFAGAVFVSGTGSDGVWAATALIPSTANGTWALGVIWEGPPQFVPSAVEHNVTGAPSFTVIGTHQPRLTAATVPALVPPGRSPFTIKGRVVDSTTGLGMAGRG